MLVWQKSMKLTYDIYKLCERLPKDEKYNLISQIKRASISIPSNIAEGSKRSSRSDFRQFCLIALGSAAEVETQLLIIRQLYPGVEISQSLDEIVDIQKMLQSLTKKLHSSEYKAK